MNQTVKLVAIGVLCGALLGLVLFVLLDERPEQVPTSDFVPHQVEPGSAPVSQSNQEQAERDAVDAFSRAVRAGVSDDVPPWLQAQQPEMDDPGLTGLMRRDPERLERMEKVAELQSRFAEFGRNPQGIDHDELDGAIAELAELSGSDSRQRLEQLRGHLAIAREVDEVSRQLQAAVEANPQQPDLDRINPYLERLQELQQAMQAQLDGARPSPDGGMH